MTPTKAEQGDEMEMDRRPSITIEQRRSRHRLAVREMKRSTIRIVLMGASLETANRGVSALAASACSMLKRYCGPCEITLLVPSRSAPDRRQMRGTHGTFAVHVVGYSRGFRAGLQRSSIWAFIGALLIRVLPLKIVRDFVQRRAVLIRAIDEADFVADLFAGDSFSDIYGLRRLFFQAVPRWCSLLLGKPYILLPQTYGPYATKVSRWIARSLVQRAFMVYTRTHDDAALVSLDPRTTVNVAYCPDVAFTLVPNNDYAKLQLRQGSLGMDDGIVTIGVNVNGLMYNGGYNRQNMFGLQLDYPRFVDEILNSLLSDTNFRVVLIPHTYTTLRLDDVENDLGAIVKVAEPFRSTASRLSIIDRELDQHEIKGVISACDAFVGSRLHSCIAGLSQGVMTIGVGYSKKFLETFSTLGVPELVVDGRDTDAGQAVRKVMRLIEDRGSYVTIISRGAERNKRIINETFAAIGKMTRSNVEI